MVQEAHLTHVVERWPARRLDVPQQSCHLHDGKKHCYAGIKMTVQSITTLAMKITTRKDPTGDRACILVAVTRQLISILVVVECSSLAISGRTVEKG